jgi:hypothetical protein
MVVVPDQVTDRSIYYKHSDANFYDAFPYVMGRALALLPQVGSLRRYPAVFVFFIICTKLIYVCFFWNHRPSLT